jgi:hypothetical protein
MACLLGGYLQYIPCIFPWAPRLVHGSFYNVAGLTVLPQGIFRLGGYCILRILWSVGFALAQDLQSNINVVEKYDLWSLFYSFVIEVTKPRFM